MWHKKDKNQQKYSDRRRRENIEGKLVGGSENTVTISTYVCRWPSFYPPRQFIVDCLQSSWCLLVKVLDGEVAKILVAVTLMTYTKSLHQWLPPNVPRPLAIWLPPHRCTQTPPPPIPAIPWLTCSILNCLHRQGEQWLGETLLRMHAEVAER